MIRKIILIGYCLFFAFQISCEKDNEFEVVESEIYVIKEIKKAGCFDNVEIDNEHEIKPIVSCRQVMENIDETAYIEFCTDYYCNATDSISLKGNVLRIFLKPPDSSVDCKCNYIWNFELEIIENKGLKILSHELENGKYLQKSEVYKHKI